MHGYRRNNAIRLMPASTEHSVLKWNDSDYSKLYVFLLKTFVVIVFYFLLSTCYNSWFFLFSDDDCMHWNDLCYILLCKTVFACCFLEDQFLFLVSYFSVFRVCDMQVGFSSEFMQSYPIWYSSVVDNSTKRLKTWLLSVHGQLH